MASASVAATAALSASPPSDQGQARPDGAPDSMSASAAGPKSSKPVHFPGCADTNEGGTNQTNDGRVRNPVPNKLKGMTDNKNGNFGVMHIDISSSQAALRNAAAKRTSEETEAAARLANMRGYRSIKRSKLAWNPTSDQDTTTFPPATSAAVAAASVPQAPMTPQNTLPTPSETHANAPTAAAATAAPSTASSSFLGLAAHETKLEQARLLASLRTLHPVAVVEQLCKALTYFGGIPNAPPPNNNIFPQSVKNNGQGSLFISWMAEIFPHTDGSPGTMAAYPSAQYPQLSPPTSAAVALTPTPASGPSSLQPPLSSTQVNADAPTSTPTAPLKRPRGRPKGSKGTKARKDKGMRKSGVAIPSSDLAESGNSSTLFSLNPTHVEQDQATEGADGSNQQSHFVAVNALSQHETAQLGPDSSIMSTPGTGKKRGRPKGSKNRPKPHPEGAQEASGTNLPPLETSGSINNASSQSPLLQKSNHGYANLGPPGNGLHRGSEQQQQASPTRMMRKDVLEEPISTAGSQHPSANKSIFPSTTGWAGPGMQIPENRHQQMNAGNQAMARKRKPGDPGLGGDLELSLGQLDASPRMQQQQHQQHQQHHQHQQQQQQQHQHQHQQHQQHQHQQDKSMSEQSVGLKRRRVSNDISSGFAPVDSNSPRMDMSVSPGMNNNYNGVNQTMSSRGFDSQISGAARNVPNQQHLQHHSQQQHNMQPQQASQGQPNQSHQQNHQFAAQSLQQQASTMRPRPQHQGQMPPVGTRPRSQAPMYSTAPASISQSYYTQHRQMPGMMGQVGNTSNGFGRSASAQSAAQFSPGMGRQGSNDSNVVNLVQQGAVAGARSQQGQSAGRQPSGFAGQQAPNSSAPTSNLGQFQGFGENSYLEIDYGLNDRDVQDAAAAAFNDAHLDTAALVEPTMRERIYQVMGPRR